MYSPKTTFPLNSHPLRCFLSPLSAFVMRAAARDRRRERKIGERKRERSLILKCGDLALLFKRKRRKKENEKQVSAPSAWSVLDLHC